MEKLVDSLLYNNYLCDYYDELFEKYIKTDNDVMVSVCFRKHDYNNYIDLSFIDDDLLYGCDIQIKEFISYYNIVDCFYTINNFAFFSLSKNDLVNLKLLYVENEKYSVTFYEI